MLGWTEAAAAGGQGSYIDGIIIACMDVSLVLLLFYLLERVRKRNKGRGRRY